jgi:hypothetical protein
VVKKRRTNTAVAPDRIRELRAELARRIAFYIGPAEKRITEIPGLLFVRRTGPTAPESVTYEPSLAVVAQGRKRADLGPTTFIFDESRFLLTSLDLPVVSQVLGASEEVPYLCLLLKLEMSIVRELLSREEVQAPEAPSDTPAMATGEITSELLGACCRLVELLDHPQDIPFLGSLIHARSYTGFFKRLRERAFVQSQHLEIKVTARRRRSRGSGQTMRNRYGWMNSQNSLGWAYPRCTIISGP